MEKSYWARFYQEDDGRSWSVDVPDLPGCFTCGDSWEDALYMAEDAVRGWLETTLEDGEPLPEARGREAVASLPVDSEMGEAKLELISVNLFDDDDRRLCWPPVFRFCDKSLSSRRQRPEDFHDQQERGHKMRHKGASPA